MPERKDVFQGTTNGESAEKDSASAFRDIGAIDRGVRNVIDKRWRGYGMFSHLSFPISYREQPRRAGIQGTLLTELNNYDREAVISESETPKEVLCLAERDSMLQESFTPCLFMGRFTRDVLSQAINLNMRYSDNCLLFPIPVLQEPGTPGLL